MQRHVTAGLVADVEKPARIVLSLAAAAGNTPRDERLELRLDGVTVPLRELIDRHGTRLHVATLAPGRMVVDYAATVVAAPPAVSDELDTLHYLRPSRYCESDSLVATAMGEFSGLSGVALLEGVSSWVGTRLRYVPGSSLPTDGAVRTLIAREGVCRDFAHLTIALLRALDVPARLVSVYAPGLAPMDFHAVAEALVDDRWLVVDPTTLAPRQTMVRIATGLDAAETAFLSSHDGGVALRSLEVTAVADELPADDVRIPVQLV